VALAARGIADGAGLKAKGPVWFQKEFALRGPGAFLGRTLPSIHLADLEELCRKLKWKWPPK
jgi:hypothetical protein